MKHVLLYWSHICVLHRQEKMFLAKLTEKLRARGIELEVRYFGLGYPQHMFEYLAQPKQDAENILSSSLVTDMPIGAYQAVRQQQANTALCPSLYGLRADEKETFLYTPQEGAVLIPSYFCARKSLPEDVARYIANEILCQELCDFYVANGDLILYPACTTLHSKQETGLFACPSAKWLEALDPEEFLAMYTKHLPSAVNVF